eukprot:jgi/Ulvmu1/7429/UM036_0090.1
MPCRDQPRLTASVLITDACAGRLVAHTGHTKFFVVCNPRAAVASLSRLNIGVAFRSEGLASFVPHTAITMGVLKVASSAEFQQHIGNAEGKSVFVDFFAEWCGPCKMVAPMLEELSSKYPNVIFLKVDVDKCEDLAQKYGIRAMPTFIAFRKGEQVEQVVGANMGKIEALLEQINQATAFTGEGNTLGGGTAAVDQGDAAAAREARAKAAEARLAALAGQ